MAPRPFWNAVAPMLAAAIIMCAARLEIRAVLDRASAAHSLDQAHALERDAVGHRMEAGRAVGLEAMGQRIHAGGGGDCAGRPTVSSGSEMTITGIIFGWKMIFLDAVARR